MARPYRIQVEEGFYHITSRGDDRKAIFKSDKDHIRLLEYIKAAKDKFKFYVHCYCLMSNHYHLLIETTQANLSRLMQYINTSYTVYFNTRHQRSGHLFQGRYKSILVEEDVYYAELTRYIHLNPVRARMVNSPEDHPWSSYKCYLNNKSDLITDMDKVKERLFMDTRSYKDFVSDGVKGCPNPLKGVYAGMILGSEKFIKDNIEQFQEVVGSKDYAYKRVFEQNVEPAKIVQAVAKYFKIDPGSIKTGGTRPMTAKKAAIYLLRANTSLTNAQIGDMFGMKYSAVSKAAGNFEKEIAEDKRIKKMVGEIVSSFEV